MKLSEAIRLGAMVHKQAFGTFREERKKYLGGLIGPLETRTCALGAAGFAVGAVASTQTYAHFPILQVDADCPACVWYVFQPTLFSVISHLNDAHHWSRERIADYVSELEDADARLRLASYDDAAEAYACR